ncbi:MAG: biotin--[acetyl-CoA-carboxylase] ligase [Gammaproteobacteria bacterium]|nr:biotin--[acetyl-CoA-carboxylase] ligase [Gammaproteobacteria bacterium]
MFLALTVNQNKLITNLCDGHTVPDSKDVWQTLDLLGLSAQVVTSKGGLHLAKKIKLVDAAQVRAALSAGVAFEHHLLIDSTNNALMSKPRSKNRVACTAEMQGAGRGRRGRAWVSPFGQNLALSFMGGIDLAMSQLEGLSVAIGVELAEVLRNLGFKDVGVKWPNDLITKTGKLGGVLIELDQLPGGSSRVCVGVGLNVAAAPDFQEIDQVAVALGSGLVSRTELVIRFVQAIDTVLSRFSPVMMSHYQARWGALDLYYGQSVRVLQGDDSVTGRNEGIDMSGCLVLDVEGDRRIFSAGEVSLRGSEL